MDRVTSGISTHAPRTGSDTAHTTSISGLNDFNPRSPHGERRGLNGRMVEAEKFQPTLPARGATESACERLYLLQISTHAPRTGSDGIKFRFNLSHIDFNPRSPHGERPRWTGLQLVCKIFQPTLPARGATYNIPILCTLIDISTHAPRTGSDDGWKKLCEKASAFQPTLPARGATALSPCYTL